MSEPRRNGSGGLRADNLSVAYGRTIVLRDVTLEIPGTTFTALLGPNGSGKSTTLRAFAGLVRPSGGSVLLDGRSISTLPHRQIALRVGVLAQGPQAPEGLTVAELVQQGRFPHQTLFSRWSSRDEAACDLALSLTGMRDLASRPLDSLSGGQRQRAWIAMTLAQETDILLLDEPTTYLDLAHQIEVMEVIAMLVRDHKKTVVAVLHDINQAARYADHVALLAAGRLVALGSARSVLTAETIDRVFGVPAMVMDDPVTGAPMCVPLSRAVPMRDLGRAL
jgi:iron complex transport system ATP-binding protein